MIPQEQTEQIKKQLIQQIEATFPDDKKAQAISQIEAMDAEQLKEFLIQNKLIKVPQQGEKIPQTSQCVFCSIASGEAQSYKIDENTDAIAVLEINPISKGHSLIIPKQHISESPKLPKTIFALAKKVSKKLKTKLKPKDVEIASSNLFGHEVVNVFPIYENENLNSERQPANPDELGKLQKLLQAKPRKKTVKKPAPKKVEKTMKLPTRIP